MFCVAIQSQTYFVLCSLTFFWDCWIFGFFRAETIEDLLSNDDQEVGDAITQVISEEDEATRQDKDAEKGGLLDNGFGVGLSTEATDCSDCGNVNVGQLSVEKPTSNATAIASNISNHNSHSGNATVLSGLTNKTSIEVGSVVVAPLNKTTNKTTATAGHQTHQSNQSHQSHQSHQSRQIQESSTTKGNETEDELETGAAQVLNGDVPEAAEKNKATMDAVEDETAMRTRRQKPAPVTTKKMLDLFLISAQKLQKATSLKDIMAGLKLMKDAHQAHHTLRVKGEGL